MLLTAAGEGKKYARYSFDNRQDLSCKDFFRIFLQTFFTEQGYLKSMSSARRKLRRRSTPSAMSLFFAASFTLLEAWLVAAFRSSRGPPLAKMLEVSIATVRPS